MKKEKHTLMIAALNIICSLGCVLSGVTSCDTPRSIAWSYYYCAKDTLEAGDPFAAKHYLKACKKSVSSELTVKADSLMEVINRVIEERK